MITISDKSRPSVAVVWMNEVKKPPLPAFAHEVMRAEENEVL